MNTYHHLVLKERGIIMPNTPGTYTMSFTVTQAQKEYIDQHYHDHFTSRSAMCQAMCLVGMNVMMGNTKVVPVGAPDVDEQELDDRVQVFAAAPADPLVQMALDLLATLRGEVEAELKAQQNGHEKAAIDAALDAFKRNLVAFLPEIEAK